MMDEGLRELPPLSEEESGESSPAAAPPGSLWEIVQERRAAAAAERHLDLPLPGLGGLLALRCGPISGGQTAKINARLQTSKSPDREFNVNADYLIAATQAIVGRLDASDAMEVQTDEDGEPLGLDERLAARFGLPTTGLTGRQMIRALFGLAPSPELAVNIAGGEYLQWAASVNADLDEETSGET